jgi:hypothetical protein
MQLAARGVWAAPVELLRRACFTLTYIPQQQVWEQQMVKWPQAVEDIFNTLCLAARGIGALEIDGHGKHLIWCGVHCCACSMRLEAGLRDQCMPLTCVYP